MTPAVFALVSTLGIRRPTRSLSKCCPPLQGVKWKGPALTVGAQSNALFSTKGFWVQNWSRDLLELVTPRMY